MKLVIESVLFAFVLARVQSYNCNCYTVILAENGTVFKSWLSDHFEIEPCPNIEECKTKCAFSMYTLSKGGDYNLVTPSMGGSLGDFICEQLKMDISQGNTYAYSEDHCSGDGPFIKTIFEFKGPLVCKNKKSHGPVILLIWISLRTVNAALLNDVVLSVSYHAFKGCKDYGLPLLQLDSWVVMPSCFPTVTWFDRH